MKKAEIEVHYIDSMGDDLRVVDAARVSFSKQSDWKVCEDEDGAWHELHERDEKLIGYLGRHKHTSPFNHCFASFRVKAPIFVARQLVKHKFLPWNEESRRYVDHEPEFYVPLRWRERADNVKQGSGNILPESQTIAYSVELMTNKALEEYNKLLDLGVAPEMARMVLPQNTMTEWMWSGSLGAWADMCRLRLDDHAQVESRVVAQMIAYNMENIFPVSWKALMGVK